MMILLLFVTFILCDIEVVQVHVLSRHCDRVPFYRRVIPNDPVNWRTQLDMDYGELTALGQNQCYQLGQRLKTRYLDETSENYVKGLNPRYSLFDYVFQASDTNRTMRTAYSIGMGLFPIGSGRKIDIENTTCALPNCSQPIPIRTIAPAGSDPYLRGFENCNGYQYLLLAELENDKNFHSPENEAKAKHINDILGLTGDLYIGLDKWDVMYDLVNCQWIHELLHIPGLNVTMVDEVHRIVNEFRTVQFRRNITDKYLGGNFVRLVLEGMDRVVKNESGTYDKYKQYTAHEVTILSVAAALGFTTDYPSLFHQQPLYGSTLAFELLKDGDQYFVRIVFLLGYDSKEFVNVGLGKSIGECDAEKCQYSKFVDITNQSSSSTVKEFCEYCKTDEREMCFEFKIEELKIELENEKKKKKKDDNNNNQSLLIIGWAFAGFMIFISFCLYCVICCCLCVFSGILLLKRNFDTKILVTNEIDPKKNSESSPFIASQDY